MILYKWIKCSEKMPPKDGRYIVYVPYKTWAWIGVSSLREGKFDDTHASYWTNLPCKPDGEK